MTQPATAGMLSKVMGLLNKADSTDFPEEAAALRAKAHELMQKYRLAEEELIAVDPTSVLPQWVEVTVCLAGSKFSQSYLNLAYYAAQHAGVRYMFNYTRLPSGEYANVLHACGYEGDLRMLEWVYASMRAVFQERLEPAVNATLSDAENIYRLRSAGITRQEVSAQVWGIETHASLSKVGAIYKAECARRGEVAALDGRGISAAQYRTAYAANFVWEMSDRLRRARDASDGTAGALVFHGRTERVDEAFYERFDYMRPTPKTEVAEVPEEKTPAQVKAEEKAAAKRERAAERRFQRGPTQKELAARRARTSAASQAGQRAGEAAARQVELDRASNARRVDPGSGRTALEG